MSNLDFQNLETFLFAENKEDFIKKLIPGTDIHHFFSILNSLNTSNKLNTETEAQAQEYFTRFGNETAQSLYVRSLLKKYDDPSTPKAKKDEIIDELVRRYLYFNFNYSKPSDIVTSAMRDNSNSISTLDQSRVSIVPELDKIYKNPHEFEQLQQEAYTKLDTKKIAEGSIHTFEKFLFSAQPTDYEDFPSLVIEYMKKSKKDHISAVYPLFERMSKTQLEELATKDPNFSLDSEFVQTLFRKEFEVPTLQNIGAHLPKQERRDLLYKFYLWVKKQHTAFPSLVSNTLYEILQLDLEINKFDQNLFIEYLKNPIRQYICMPQEKQKVLRERPRDRSIDFAQERISINSLIPTYLSEFFKTAKDTQPFNEYFESPFLQEIFYTTKLMEGQVVESKTALTPERLKTLAEQKELTICKYNQEFYKTGDPVNISVLIKNVPSLTVKVFEFKPENYYRKEQKQLDGTINLDGLIAAEEYNYDFNEAPVIKFTKEFTFKSISEKKQGIFIVDFIGNGLSSRAVIRKGKLAFVEYQTLAGQLFEIIDDSTAICKGKYTGIWIEDRFYKADDKGRILVPFTSDRSVKAVLVHYNLSELVDIALRSESFEFKCSYIYNYESFLMGNKAKVLVQPRLFINTQPTSLDVIQSCSAIVTTTNDEGISSRNNFNNIKLSVSEEAELEFTVPAKLSQINIEFKAKIVPTNKREPKEYNSQHKIEIDLQKDTSSFCNLYLRYTKDGYELNALGKNGEPKSGLTFNIVFQNKYLYRAFSESLQTDQNGRISLGKLEEITKIEAHLQPIGDIRNIYRSWIINNQKKVNYPSIIRICEKDSVTLPLLSGELNRHKISFTKVCNGSVISNELKSLKIDKKRLIISGLQEGTYQLYLKDLKQNISVTVYKGSYWEEHNTYIYANDTLIDIKQDIDNIVITDVKVQTKPNSDLADITIEAFVDQPQRARFHIFASQFVDMDMNKVIDEMNKNLPHPIHREAFLGLKGSQFLNNRSLGDEYSYVIDRKSQTRFMGNTLEKPQVLIKKTFVRETQTTEEQLAQTQQFSPIASNLMAKRAMVGSAGPRGQAYDRAYSSINKAQKLEPKGDSFLNFLTNPCLVYSNLKADKEGIITLKDFPYQKYSLLQIIASNLSSNISEIVSLETKDIQAKDLRQKVRESDTAYSINRISQSLLKGQKTHIKDLTSTEIQIIDSLPKLFNAQKNLALGSSNPGNGSSYDEWDFLKDWESLSNEEKLKKYDKYASHEVNLFVYFKDKEFYNQVVFPFLQNKLEKTLIDYFLVDDKKKMAEYGSTESFQSLNSLEKILVILSLHQSDPNQAKSLTASLELAHSTQKVDTQMFNRCFDTILLSKKVEEEQVVQNHNFREKLQEQASFRSFKCEEAECLFEASDFVRSAAPESFGPKQMKTAAVSQLMMKDARLDDYDSFGGNEFLEKRAKVQAGFQELEKTKEYTERHYYGRIDKQIHLPLNSFWVDAAKHIVDNGFSKPFVSSNLIFAHSSHTEMIAVLSLISLPFKPGNHAQSSYEGRGLQLQAESDLLIFSKAVTEAESKINEDILIRQRFFDPQDRHTESEEEPGVYIEKEVDQYVVNKVYGSTVIVTNSSASSQQLQVLVEIPEGSIPINSLDYTKSHTLQLSPFATRTIESWFYFPTTGKFKIIAPSVSKKGTVVAVGKKIEIEVKTEKTYTSFETLTAILTKGTKDDVLNFVKTKNIWNSKVFNFDAVYWLLTDKEFFLKFIQILRERKYFNAIVWQFGFYHKDEQTMKEYFISSPTNTISSMFLYLDSSLLTVDKYNVLEYNPFVNQRAHVLADSKNRILNVQMKEQYNNLLKYFCERNSLETKHNLGLMYYLLLQDRVQDTIKIFSKIDRDQLRQDHVYELQYDYFSAYIDFYIGAPKFSTARDICKKYLNYPVLSWRSLFVEVANQLAEYDGAEVINNEMQSEEKQQNLSNADKEETVSIEIQNNQLNVNHQNVKEITLAFYRIDLEILFSRNPFIDQSKDEFSFIQPNETKTFEVANPKTLEKSVYDIPENLKKYNLYIELRTENKTLSTTYFSTSLHVQIIESYGQVKVLDKNDKPLSHVYVKCFAKDKNNKVSFYKDGYTDLRGRFDYATLNSNDISNINRFAIFVMSDELGSLIREAKPPSKLGRIE